MALTLVKEDGTGKANANSYADVAGSDAYFEGHLYPAAWTAATSVQKAAALVMATRLIDAQFQFNGYKLLSTQALQWPRERCPDPDRQMVDASVLSALGTNFVLNNVVPAGVVNAACEMARELLIVDRTAAPAGEGLDTVTTSSSSHESTGSGSQSNASTTKYCKTDVRPIICAVAQALLSKYGALFSGGSGAVRLVRA